MITTDRQNVLHRLGALSSTLVTAIAKEPNEAQLDVLVGEVRQALIDVGGLRGDGDDELTPLDDFMRPVVERLERLNAPASNDSLPLASGIGSGFIDLDAITAGFRPGELIVVAGAAKVGKTSFALNIAEHVALKEKRPVAIVSMRQSGWEIAERLLSLTGMIDAQQFRSGRLTEDDWDRITRALCNLLGLNIQICESGGIGPVRLKMLCREMSSTTGALGLIIIDDLECLSEPDVAGRCSTELNLRLMKAMARELNVAVMVLSNLSRPKGETVSKWPWASYLGGNGNISRDVDWVLLIHRHQNRGIENDGFMNAEVIVAAHNGDPVGAVQLLFDPRYLSFRNRACRSHAEECRMVPAQPENASSFYDSEKEGQTLKRLDTHDDPLLGFFLDGRPDHTGRTLERILRADDSWLETTHDYVQWLFPLRSSSDYNPYAPTLDLSTIRAFAENDQLPANQRRAFVRMMAFYGFVVEEVIEDGVVKEVYVDHADTFGQRSRLWVTPGNHNYKRITRILRSLSILSSPQYARGLGVALRPLYREYGGRIGKEAFAFWESAAFGHKASP